MLPYDVALLVRARRLAFCLPLAFLIAGCASSTSPVEPTPVPVTQAPKITCPAPMSVTSAAGSPFAQVSYPDPTTTGGTAPTSIKCSPPTASSFAVGATPVRCQVTDAQERTDSCTFTVTVLAPPP